MLKTVATGGGGTSGLTYKGTWNASANLPALSSGSGVNGDYYVVNVAGSTNLDGITDWQIGDWAIFNGTVWQKIDQSDTVTSVNGQVGAVVLNAANVGAAANTVNVIAGTGLTGGGALTGNVTITLANTAVAAGSYGTATDVSQITIDAQGRITSAANVAIAISTANVSGLGTIATQNANAVVITGGSATLANVTVTSNLYANLATSNTAAMPDPSLPLAPEGYITVYVNGNAKKIPYYGV
jgi:hypothetical protein